jgi:hypothetical protein
MAKSVSRDRAPGVQQQPIHDPNETLPFTPLDVELLASGRGQPIELRATIIVGHAPRDLWRGRVQKR